MEPSYQFNPNGLGIDNGTYFGLPYSVEESRMVILPVPWDVTTSYGAGTATAPDAILEASLQVDLHDVHYPGGWCEGIGTVDINDSILTRSRRLREDAQRVIAHLASGGTATDDYVLRKLHRVNDASEGLNREVYSESQRWLERGKRVAVLGGDHSVPLGLIKAVGDQHKSFGILHLDAHADLRCAYEGFKYSHASIMYNVLEEVSSLTSLVQVGVRDFCDEEIMLVKSDPRIHFFSDYSLAADRFRGETWDSICNRIVAALPAKVYISFDIDALTPDNCPHTGTPVPGGLSYGEAIYLLHKVVEARREVVGFDLCEVSPAEGSIDANVGARVLYKLCNLMLKSIPK